MPHSLNGDLSLGGERATKPAADRNETSILAGTIDALSASSNTTLVEPRKLVLLRGIIICSSVFHVTL